MTQRISGWKLSQLLLFFGAMSSTCEAGSEGSGDLSGQAAPASQGSASVAEEGLENPGQERSAGRPTGSTAGVINVFGDDFLTSGKFRRSGKSRLFGEEANVIRPRLHVYGEYTTMAGGGEFRRETAEFFLQRVGRGSIAQVGHSLVLDANLQLTGTEKVQARFRPFDNNKLRPSIYRFRNTTNLDDDTLHLDANPDLLWFQGDLGEMFDFLDPESRYPLDFNVAGGIIPIYVQDTYLLSDEMVGLAIAKNNIYFPAVSNWNVMVFAGFDGIDARFNQPEVFSSDNQARLYGVSSYLDWRRAYIETTLAYLHARKDDSASEYFLGVSATKALGLWGVTGRMLFNTGSATDNGVGQMYVLETNRPLTRQHTFYGNFFSGTSGWHAISTRNPMQRIGLGFFQNKFGMPPVLKRNGTDSAGAALGVKFRFKNNEVYVNPELALLKDRSDIGNDQMALSLEVGAKLTSRLFLRAELRAIFNSEFGNEYGVAFPLVMKF